MRQRQDKTMGPNATPKPYGLNEAARRALAEAEERRRQKKPSPSLPRAEELGGREGPDPVRYGDWEVKGIASDF